LRVPSPLWSSREARAHTVGRKGSEKSARGKNAVPVEDRDDVDSLLPACSACHTEIDKKRSRTFSMSGFFEGSSVGTSRTSRRRRVSATA
jgi:hypothetical protein